MHSGGYIVQYSYSTCIVSVHTESCRGRWDRTCNVHGPLHLPHDLPELSLFCELLVSEKPYIDTFLDVLDSKLTTRNLTLHLPNTHSHSSALARISPGRLVQPGADALWSTAIHHNVSQSVHEQ
jgi:hypothetical protein